VPKTNPSVATEEPLGRQTFLSFVAIGEMNLLFAKNLSLFFPIQTSLDLVTVHTTDANPQNT